MAYKFIVLFDFLKNCYKIASHSAFVSCRHFWAHHRDPPTHRATRTRSLPPKGTKLLGLVLAKTNMNDLLT